MFGEGDPGGGGGAVGRLLRPGKGAAITGTLSTARHYYYYH